MMSIDVTQVLNDRFDCKDCHAHHAWVPIAKPVVRLNSRVYRLQCTRCQARVVAKVSHASDADDGARARARKEYERLRMVELAFPQDEHYGTLAPLGYLESAGQGIMITRLFPGRDLAHYVETLDAMKLRSAFRSAGIWLGKLHGCQIQSRRVRLGNADKIGYLHDTYGTVLNGDQKTREACEVLTQTGPHVDVRDIRAVRLHGDFKPDNMLCDGARYVGLDIAWEFSGAAVYDLAPFLNHLRLLGPALTSPRRRRLHDQAEVEFLAGYGGSIDMHALQWTRLYFALCYLGKYRQRGVLASGYGNWKVLPLVRTLVRQLQEAV